MHCTCILGVIRARSPQKQEAGAKQTEKEQERPPALSRPKLISALLRLGCSRRPHVSKYLQGLPPVLAPEEATTT